ncbi:LCP family protein [Candidatus Villigracilis affinis]|uniref:LCP family protein n=1 Tax=Candidatus Villigracilis affinis TaxID=3140682 RepID=UPI001D8F3BD5|nr:LCP family protein [Anaerolineales bacterium]MBL0345524.1 LCP family protein [Anaerolineales bacterium]
MTRSQKQIIAVLSIVALVLISAAGIYAFRSYRAFVTQPLGPSLPIAAQTMPPTWTPAATSPVGMVTLVPTLSFTTPTPYAGCGGTTSVMHVVAVGADSRSDNYQYGLGDVIRLVRIDFVTPKVSVLEFPRDLWVEIPYISDNLNGQDHEKLNQAYLYGQPGDGFHYWDDPSAGPGLLSLTLNLNFGAQVDHYVAVNMRTFVNVVNAVEGIDLNVPDDNAAQNTGLPIGKHHLNGDQALKVARNREEGVFERASNQNRVLCALRQKLASPKVVTKIPDLIDSFQDNILTDFTPEQLGQLACLGTKLPPENITFASFPQELFKESRIYDPVFKKNVFYWDVDFSVLRDYTSRFQAGTWPEPNAITTDEEDEEEIICE